MRTLKVAALVLAPCLLSGKRRLRHEMAALVEDLNGAVRGEPGITMTMLAATMGIPVKDLQRPMNILKAASRVKSVGERNWTRYFPVSNGAVSTA